MEFFRKRKEAKLKQAEQNQEPSLSPELLALDAEATIQPLTREQYVNSYKARNSRWRGLEGVKFHPPVYNMSVRNMKKSGKKCLDEKCERITGNPGGYCFRHVRNPINNNKYLTLIPRTHYDEIHLRHKND